MTLKSLTLLILLFNSIHEFETKSSKPILIFDWTYIEFVYRFVPLPDVMRIDLLDYGQYIPENNEFSQLKYHRNHFFVNIPKHLDGVGSALNYIFYDSEIMTNVSDNVPLIPYPDWRWQGRPSSRNCEKSFKNIETYAIDIYDRVWIFDLGIDLSQDQMEPKCPSKIVVLDLIENRLLRIFTFKQQKIGMKLKKPKLINYKMVVNCISIRDCSAFVSLNGQIVVYNYEKNSARVFQVPKLTWEITKPKHKIDFTGNSDRHQHPKRFLKKINRNGDRDMVIQNMAIFDHKLYLAFENKPGIYWIPASAFDFDQIFGFLKLPMDIWDIQINLLDISPNGQLYYTHSKGSEIRVYDLKSGNGREISGNFTSVSSFAFDVNNYDGQVYFIDKTEGSLKFYKTY